MNRNYLLLSVSIFLTFCFILNTSAPAMTPQSEIPATTDTHLLEQKIAQLMMPAVIPNQENKALYGFENIACSIQDIKQLLSKYPLAGAIFLGRMTHEQLHTLTTDLRKAAVHNVLFSLDAEWGPAMRVSDDPKLPRALTMGALPDDKQELLKQHGYLTGIMACNLGIDIMLGPVLDVNSNPHNIVIHDRAFSNNVNRVSLWEHLVSQGLHDVGILYCPKHYPGHGRTKRDSHEELPTNTATKKEIQDDLQPFINAINHNTPMIMVGHVAVPVLDESKLPATLSHKITTELLRDTYNFKGVIISDSLAMKALPDLAPGELELQVLKAGIDIILCPRDTIAAINRIAQAIRTGELSEQRIDESLERIAELKKLYANLQNKHKSTPEITDIKATVQTFNQEVFQNAIAYIQRTPQHFDIQDSVIIYIGDTTPTIITQLHKHIDQPIKHYFVKTQEDLKTIPYAKTAILVPLGLTRFIKNQCGVTESFKTLIAQTATIADHTVLCLFASPYALQYLNVDQIHDILIAFEPEEAAVHAAADILAQKQKAVGTLPLSIEGFKKLDEF